MSLCFPITQSVRHQMNMDGVHPAVLPSTRRRPVACRTEMDSPLPARCDWGFRLCSLQQPFPLFKPVPLGAQRPSHWCLLDYIILHLRQPNPSTPSRRSVQQAAKRSVSQSASKPQSTRCSRLEIPRTPPNRQKHTDAFRFRINTKHTPMHTACTYLVT